MLLKLEKFEAIGQFASLQHKAPQLESFSLIYARNGNGKSTFCSVLRSASEQKPAQIVARKKLGSKTAQQIQLSFRSIGPIIFSGGKWNNSPGKIYVFDSEYVRQNVHVAENVTRDNKRSLFSVIIGEQGVKLAESISELDVEQREIVALQAAAERSIRTAFPQVHDVGALVSALVPDDLPARIVTATKNAELARMTLAVRAKKDLRCPILDQLDELTSLAEKTIDGLSSDALSRIKDHIGSHGMITNGEKWLKYGVEHSDGISCPYCTQSISDVPIVASFKLYFSQAYEDFCAEIEACIGRLEEILGSDGTQFEQLFLDNATDVDFWKTVCELPDHARLEDTIMEEVKSSLTCTLKLLQEKARNPLSRSVLADSERVQEAFGVFRAYLNRIAACNAVIQEARLASSTIVPVKAQEILGKLQALNARVSGSIKSDVDGWSERDKRRSIVERLKKSQQEGLKAYVAKTVVEKEKSINLLLELFGARFRISGTKASFVGRDANTDYSIAIGPHLVPAGTKSDTAPSFDTVLSSGDKNTLALALFFVQVSSDANLSSATVVLDDPFNSQDIARQWETTSQIRMLAGKASQVIVLSHDPRFLALIEKNTRQQIGTFQILCDDRGAGEIRKWSSDDELRDIYARQSERIREYASTGACLPETTVESISKDLRPFLEFYLKARFPGRFTQTAMLDAMITENEAAGADDPMFVQVANMRAINEYGRDNMHGGAAVPDPTALRAQCNRIVRIVGSY